jgi:hypothetical protein
VTIADLDSRNGTFVNGVPIKQRVLEHGDHIRMGESEFLFSETSSVPSACDRPGRAIVVRCTLTGHCSGGLAPRAHVRAVRPDCLGHAIRYVSAVIGRRHANHLTPGR